MMQTPFQWGRKAGAAAAVCALLLASAGCEKYFQDHKATSLDAANKKYAEGDFKGAVQFYEDALDGTPATAETHYKLALLFDDKLANPLAATYHFQRYLDLTPAGPHAKEAANFMKQDELKVATTLSHGALMSQEDAARLKNDNLALRKQLAELRASRAPVTAGSMAPDEPAAPPPPGSRTYAVESGDTLASISRKFYGSSAHWQKIQSANKSVLKGTVKLKPGMTLVIPK